MISGGIFGEFYSESAMSEERVDQLCECILYVISECHTLSKAFATSSTRTPVYFFLFRLCTMYSVSHAVSRLVEWSGRKPNCEYGSTCSSSISAVNLARMIFSTVFSKQYSRLIGR